MLPHLSPHRARSPLQHSQPPLHHSALQRPNQQWPQKKASSAGSRIFLQQSQRRQRPSQPLHPRLPKAVKPAMAATETATAAVPSPEKAAPMDKAATRPTAKAVAHAVKAVVTDAIAVVDAVGVAAALTAKGARSASDLTQKANPCPWTQICRRATKPRLDTMATVRNNAPIAHPVNAVNAAAAVDVVQASAMKRVTATSSRALKTVPMLLPKVAQTTLPPTAKAKPARVVVKAAVRAAMAAVVAMDVAPAPMARHATQVAKPMCRPS